MIFYILDSEEKIVETIQSPEEEGTGGITALEGTVDEKLDSYELLELTVPADSTGLEKIKEEMTIIFKDISGWREYAIYEIEDEDGSNFNTVIKAELASSELIDEIIETDYSGVATNPKTVLDKLLEGTRYKAGHVDSSIYSQAFNVNTEYMNVLEAINEYSSNYSAEIRFSYQVDGNKVVNRFVDVYKTFGEYKGKIFEIDRDITSVKRTVNTENIKTTIIPYSKELEEETPEDAPEDFKPKTYRIDIKDVEWSIANGDPVDKPKGQNYLVDPTALENWGKKGSDGKRRHKKISMEFDLDNAESIASMAWVQLGRYTQPTATYELKAVDIYEMTKNEDLKHEQILLGDTGGVKDHYFARPIEIQTRLVEAKRDLFDSRNNDYVFGSSKEIFSVNASIEKARDVAKTVDEAINKFNDFQLTLDGKNKVFRGSNAPVNPIENDIWFRPHPSKQGHTQMTVFNGVSWVIEADSSDLEDATRLKFGVLDGAQINVINLIADNITGGQLRLETGLEITNKGVPILSVNEDGEVEFSVKKLTIGVRDIEKELDRIAEFENGKSAYEIAVENGFTGTEVKWLESLKGQDGNNGVKGETGADGKTQYLHIAYATSANGSTGFDRVVSDGKTYIGQYTDFIETDSSDYKKYSWSKFKGEDGYTPVKGTDYFDGINGQDGQDGDSSFLWVRYSQNANGNPMTDSPTNAKYVGLATTTTSTAPTSYTAYKWALVKGSDGIDGEKGADGKTSYLHIRYSNDGGTTFTANNGETAGDWIGTYVDFVEADSTSVSKYTWNKVKGDTGPKGATGSQGPRGAEGTSVSSITEYYLATASGSGVTTSTSGWSNAVQTISGAKKYLWNYEKVNFSNGASQDTIPVIIGVYGDTGPQGPKGSTGSAGATGATGRSITNVTEYYLASTSASGVTRSTTGWTNAMQVTTDTKKYLWNYEKIDWNVAPLTTYVEPIIIGVHGAQGPQGLQGVSITSVDVEYAQNTSATTAPTTGWSTTAPAWKDANFMWSRTKTTYSSGSPTYSTPACITGQKGPTGSTGSTGPTGSTGATGRGISSIQEEYYLSRSKDITTGGEWVTTPPTWITERYMWTRSKINYTNPTSVEYTTAVVDTAWEALEGVSLKDKTEILSGNPIFTDKADDSVVHVEVDGKSVQNGAPSPDYPIAINSLDKSFDIVSSVGGRNLLLDTKWVNLNLWTLESDKHLGLPIYSRQGIWGGIKQKYAVKKGEQYTFSLYAKSDVDFSPQIYLYVGSGNQGVTNIATSVIELTTTFKRFDITFTVLNDGMIEPRLESFTSDRRIYVSGIRLNEGSTATPYSQAPEDIQYNTQSPTLYKTNILLSEPLRSVGDVKDRLYLDSADGLWKVERNIEEVILDGTIGYSRNNSLKNSQEVRPNGIKVRIGTELISNRFKLTSSTWGLDELGLMALAGAFGTYREVGFRIPVSYTSGSTYFSENPTKLLFVKLEPTIETLSAEQQTKLNNIQSFKESNYVYTVEPNKSDTLSPTLHATFKSKGWYSKYLVDEEIKLVSERINDKVDKDIFDLTLEELTEAKSLAMDAINSEEYQTFIAGYDEYKQLMEVDKKTAEETLQRINDTLVTIENNLGDSAEKWNFINTSITNSEGGIAISNERTSMSVVIGSDRISFYDNGVEVAFISDKVLQINHGIFVQSAQIGAHLISSLPENNDITVVQWVGF